ncbi:MAG: PadR family transcriptional regulator [Bifidobacterium sp.]|nr:PadR family transcriptional regulator [Bifidobacterium sp.]
MPKERLLPYVILGIVRDNAPITGQGITRQFDDEIGEFWRASHSQVYPELRRMCEDGWLVQAVAPDNAKEKYYGVTQQGEHILEAWLGAPIGPSPNHHDLFALKMFFLHDRHDPRILRLMEEERGMLEGQLAHLEERDRLLFPDRTAIERSYGHHLILRRAMARVSSQLAWLDESIRSTEPRDT